MATLASKTETKVGQQETLPLSDDVPSSGDLPLSGDLRVSGEKGTMHVWAYVL